MPFTYFMIYFLKTFTSVLWILMCETVVIIHAHFCEYLFLFSSDVVRGYVISRIIIMICLSMYMVLPI